MKGRLYGKSIIGKGNSLCKDLEARGACSGTCQSFGLLAKGSESEAER